MSMKEARYTWNNQIRVTVVTRRPSPKKSVAITAWHVCEDDQIFVGMFVTIRLMLLPPLRGKGLAGWGQQKICLSCPEVRVLHHCLSIFNMWCDRSLFRKRLGSCLVHSGLGTSQSKKMQQLAGLAEARCIRAWRPVCQLVK